MPKRRYLPIEALLNVDVVVLMIQTRNAAFPAQAPLTHLFGAERANPKITSKTILQSGLQYSSRFHGNLRTSGQFHRFSGQRRRFLHHRSGASCVRRSRHLPEGEHCHLEAMNFT
ncbi:hypothetical protein L596_016044 [Steinernema carpocapsae]|uniref:Uncharacterized protein n=1 Tax=Steinernema carpocapsae TaxID=34508 RepID=A0A4U5NHU5_STECR|nr:hypothetical protein L596_016044 [Steinernema carpocapsae]